MTKKVLITGGSGLLAINWAVSIRSEYSVFLGLHDRKGINIPGVKSGKINLESVNELIKFLDTNKFDIVIHTAGITDVEYCEENPTLAYYVNATLSDNIAKACKYLQISLIYISTDHVFSGGTSLVNELKKTSPVNIYGNSKVEGECRVLESYQEALIVRTNFYGWGPGYRQSFSDFILKSLSNKEDVYLFKDVFYTPIIIKSLVDASHDLLNRGRHGIFNVTGDERISKYHFGIKVANYFGLDESLIKPICFSDKVDLVKRPLDMSLSNRKVSRVLNRKLGGVEEHLQILSKQIDFNNHIRME